MCLAAFPQFLQFNLTKEDLDSFYDWFYGPELGGRPSPPEQTLLMAERNAWREVHESMHGGMYLKEALDKVQNNSLFWMREVYERVISERAKGKSKKGKDKKGSWGYPIRQPLWEKKGKGHGDKGGKGKGKGKSRVSDWPSNWAFKNPKGVPFCRDYFIKKTCQGQCGRSHKMAALLLRILYALFPEVDWGFVFVDDFCWVLRASNASWLTPALLGVLLALGTPLSRKKTLLSEINTWLGFVINPSGPFVQMAKEKHVAVLALLKELEEGKAFSLKAIEKALGKIQWATATCPMAKPFLQPFWAWKSAVKTAGVPGKLVRCLAVLLSQLFSKQFPQMSPFSPWSSWTGASDASAEKAGESWIGGWLTDSPEPFKDKVLWFQYKVCQEHHPWAFKKNDPQKRIAALELYGTLFLALLLMAQNPSTSCRLHIPLVSDNQGNVYSILNNATRKMPTAVILMELVYQLYQAGHMLAPAHSRRDDNQWADELTHPNPQGFDPALRVDLTPYFHKLALIPKILEAGDTALWQDNMDTHL